MLGSVVSRPVTCHKSRMTKRAHFAGNNDTGVKTKVDAKRPALHVLLTVATLRNDAVCQVSQTLCTNTKGRKSPALLVQVLCTISKQRCSKKDLGSEGPDNPKHFLPMEMSPKVQEIHDRKYQRRNKTSRANEKILKSAEIMQKRFGRKASHASQSCVEPVWPTFVPGEVRHQCIWPSSIPKKLTMSGWSNCPCTP